MIKKSILLAAGAFMATGAFAATLSPQEALQRAVSTPEGKRLAKTVQPTLSYTAVDKTGDATLYVFNQAQNGGFILLSADDAAIPMLGYTDNGAFDPNNIPADMKYWMGEYTRQIEFARSRGIKGSSKMNYPSDWKYISPLCKTQWDQGAPYNDDCPTQQLQHLPTGCVATAMAQIMKYHNYPEIGRGSISYTWNAQKLSMSFDQQKFDWDNMIDVYNQGKYTEAQGKAVAYLMKACGYAAQMSYAPGASGTSTQQAGVGMVTYFNYDNNIKTSERCEFTDADWAALVYNQLVTVGPALYSGQSAEGGHAFVVDGYDGNGFFHINWGWSGMCNGFYLLTALNPTQQGTGGYMGGYNFDQSLLYDIKKPADPNNNNPSFVGELSLHGNLKAQMSGAQMSFVLTDWQVPSYVNVSFGTVSAIFAIEIQNADGSGTPSYVDSQLNRSIPVGSYYQSPNTTPTVKFNQLLPDGRYKVTLVYKKGYDYYHFLHPIDMYDYVYVTKSGSQFTVENLSPACMQISDAKITTPLYYGNPCQVEMTFHNPTDQEILQMVVPTLTLDGNIAYEGDLQMMSLAPRETVTRSLVYNFNRVNNGKVPTSAKPIDVTLGVKDTNRGITFGTFGDYTMYRASSNPQVTLDNFSIRNALEETQTEYGTLFGIENYTYVPVELIFSVGGNNAFLASPITVSVFEFDQSSLEIGNLVYEKNFENYAYCRSGSSTALYTTLNLFDYCTPAKSYCAKAYYLEGATRRDIGSLYFAADSGVDSILSNEGELGVYYSGNVVTASSQSGISSITVFDVKGTKVASATSDRLNLSGLTKGVYIIRATDKAGKSKIIKIAK